MEINFTDPTAIPLPPESARILNAAAVLHPDGRRVRVVLELTPFQQRPSGDIRITNSRGEELAEISVIEICEPHLELTLHLRGENRQAPLTLDATIYFLPEPNAATENEPTAWHKPSPLDQIQITF